MKTAKTTFALLALLALTACGASRHTASDVNLSAVPEFAFIQPYSFIVCYGDDGKGAYDEGDSKKATSLIENIINSERFPFSEMIPADYSGDNVDIQNWFRNFEDIDPAKSSRLRVPKSLRKLIDKSGLRYATSSILMATPRPRWDTSGRRSRRLPERLSTRRLNPSPASGAIPILPRTIM